MLCMFLQLVPTTLVFLVVFLGPVRGVQITPPDEYDEREFTTMCHNHVKSLSTQVNEENDDVVLNKSGRFQGMLLEAGAERKANGHKGGQLIILARTDRSGAVIMNMINAKYIAWVMDMTFLGMFEFGRHINTNATHLLNVLGLPAPILKFPNGTQTVTSLKAFFEAIKLNPVGTFYVHYNRMDKAKREMENFNIRDVAFLRELRKTSRMAPAWLWSSNATLRVAVHVRRGDVMARFLSRRILGNSYYLTIMDYIAEMAPGAEFIIFGETPFSCRRPGFLIADFAQRDDVTLRINTPLEEVWAHLASADVVIESKSTFSQVPVLYNTKGVALEALSEQEVNSAEYRDKLKAQLSPFL